MQFTPTAEFLSPQLFFSFVFFVNMELIFCPSVFCCFYCISFTWRLESQKCMKKPTYFSKNAYLDADSEFKIFEPLGVGVKNFKVRLRSWIKKLPSPKPWLTVEADCINYCVATNACKIMVYFDCFIQQLQARGLLRRRKKGRPVSVEVDADYQCNISLALFGPLLEFNFWLFMCVDCQCNVSCTTIKYICMILGKEKSYVNVQPSYLQQVKTIAVIMHSAGQGRRRAGALIPVAILEWKKWGGHCGAKEKSGVSTKISILHGDFSLFWRLSCYD